MSVYIRQLGSDDIGLMRGLLQAFGEVFNEKDTFSSKQPNAAYLQSLLASDSFIAVVALEGNVVIGGLSAYELKKYEQQRSEVYIYDLAVAELHRRKGVATALIEALKSIAAAREAYVIFIQADLGDDAAVALYTKLGVRENVLHFDIAVSVSNPVG